MNMVDMFLWKKRIDRPSLRKIGREHHMKRMDLGRSIPEIQGIIIPEDDIIDLIMIGCVGTKWRERILPCRSWPILGSDFLMDVLISIPLWDRSDV
jgi:hypothetical protein